MKINSSEACSQITQKGLELGFSAVGFSQIFKLDADGEQLTHWLKSGHQAEMRYMENYFEKRIDPAILVESSKTVVSVLFNYYSADKNLDESAPIISKYAYGKDYHLVLKDKLNKLFEFIKSSVDPLVEGRVFVDSAPVLERAWARNAGLGWMGRNSMLINPKLGSFFFIGELIISTELIAESSPINNLCGGCTKCVDACPTKAIVGDGVIDSNRCISYLTIENKDSIPNEFKDKVQNRVFGCDICQDVCPWNRKSSPNSEPDFKPNSLLLKLSLEQWQNMDEALYQKTFKQSAVKRAKFSGLRRNIDFLLNSCNNELKLKS